MGDKDETQSSIAEAAAGEEHDVEGAECLVSINIDPDAEYDLCEDGNVGAGTAAVFTPEPPEVPSFLDNVRVEQITPEIQRRLRLTLDLPSVTNTLKNWEWLASHLGMPAEEITYIRERVNYPDSPTLVVLRQYGRESLGGILRIIRDHLNRYDVIIQLLPSLYAFEEHLRSSKGKQEATAFPATVISSRDDGPSAPTVDSGIVESSHAINAGASGAFSQAVAGPSNDRPLILITFADEGPQHRKLVNWLCKNLEKCNARVILDDSLAGSATDDWTGRVSECFEQAYSIIVICSPAYFHRVDSAAPVLEGAPQPTDLHSQCSRFIYQLMCAEYRQYNCRNRRFRPVIFESAPGGNEIVPPILRNTVILRWPRQHNDLMQLIFGDSRSNPQ